MIIESVMKNQDRFFNAEDLLIKAKEQDENIGIATIYRFLNDKLKNSKIHSYECNRRKIYSLESNNHCHFICENCNQITHFSITNLNFLRNKIKGDICHFQINISGVCDNCKNIK